MNLVIIGNGIAGVTAALSLRHRAPRAAITVVSGESEYFISRTALMYAYMDRLTLRALEPYERKVYDRQSIRRIQDWVTDLDASRHELRLRSGGTLPYDRLLLATGSVPNRPAWPGLSDDLRGVVHFVSLQDLDRCERLTPSTRQAVVVGGGLIGIELVECLRHHRRPVTFLVREPWYWPAALGPEEAALITGHMRRHGVDVSTTEEVREVLIDNEGRVRAVMTTAGREVACELLGITIGVRPAIDWLRSVATPPALSRGIQVSPSFQTSLPDVFAAGDCAEIQLSGREPLVEQIWYSAKRQGELAARAMLGDAIEYHPPVFYNSAKFFEIEYTTVGDVNNAPPGTDHFLFHVPNTNATVRIVARGRHEGGRVIGFNMLGARWDHTWFERWIVERRTMDYVMEHLHRAQFDVEFGRLDLRPIRAAYAQREAETPGFVSM